MPVYTHQSRRPSRKEEKREGETAEREKEMLEQTNEWEDERNILNITEVPFVSSICDYDEQTSLCDPFFSPFLLWMHLAGCLCQSIYAR